MPPAVIMLLGLGIAAAGIRADVRRPEVPAMASPAQ
jgi:hypothetical protein